MAREALGRGLAALLKGADATAESELTELPVLQIRPNPFQPRQHFDPERLRELADSIRQQGVIQLIVVRRGAEGFELLAGERRLRAAQMAGYDTIPALVKSANDQEALEVALLKNPQREDLNPMEEARAYLPAASGISAHPGRGGAASGTRPVIGDQYAQVAQVATVSASGHRGGSLEYGTHPSALGVGFGRGAAPLARPNSSRWTLGAGDGKPGAG